MKDTTVCFFVNVFGGLLLGFGAIGINTALAPLYSCTLNFVPARDYSWHLSCLIASVNIGAAFGAIFGGSFSDFFGRKKAMIIGGILSLFSILCIFFQSYFWQFVSRIITGLGIGLVSSACGSYVSEMAPPSRRGFLGSLFQVFITIGIFLASLASYFVLGANRDLDYDDFCASFEGASTFGRIQVLMLITAVIAAFFTIFVMSPLLKESKTWQNKVNQDLKAIQSNSNSFFDLFRYKRPLAISVANACALQLTGINAVMFYCAKFLEASNVSQKILGTVVIMFWNFVTTLISLFLSDRIGRRKLLIPATGTMALSMLLLTFVVVFATHLNSTATSVIAFIILAIYIAAFEIGPGTLFWVVCNEVFPENISQTGFGFINALQWSFTLLITFTFPSLQNQMGGYVFLIFGIPGALITVFLYLCLPETKLQRRADIAALLSKNKWIVLNEKVQSQPNQYA